MVTGLQPHNSVLFPLRLEAEAVSCLINLWVTLSPGLLKKFNNSRVISLLLWGPGWYTVHLEACRTLWLYNKKMAEFSSLQSSSAQSLSHVRLFVTPWTAARQVSLSITNSQSLLKLMSFELVMPSNHHILCCPLLLLPSIFLSIRVFSKESFICIRQPKSWSSSFSISPSNEYSGLISFRIIGLISL